MLRFRMGHEILQGPHNGRHPGLIISAKESGAVGDHNVLALVLQDFREILRRKDDILFLVQADILPVIAANHPAFDGTAGGIGTGVHMGNKSHRLSTYPIGRKGGHDITVLIQTHLREPHGLQFLRQMTGQRHLPRRAGIHLVIVLVGLGIVRNIIFKPFQKFFCI